MSRCFLDPAGHTKGLWMPLSLTGGQLEIKLKQHLDELMSDYELCKSLKEWFDELLHLDDDGSSAKGKLDHNILFERPYSKGTNTIFHPVVQEWVQDHTEILEMRSSKKRSVEDAILQNLGATFNKIFFAGGLPQDRCEIYFISKSNKNWDSYAWGYCAYLGEIPDERHTVVKIHEESLEYTAQMQHYIGTLLHELCHAIITTYCCDCKSCILLPDHPYCHGIWFARIAHQVQGFATRILSLSCSLGIGRSVAIELVDERLLSPVDWHSNVQNLGTLERKMAECLDTLGTLSKESGLELEPIKGAMDEYLEYLMDKYLDYLDTPREQSTNSKQKSSKKKRKSILVKLYRDLLNNKDPREAPESPKSRNTTKQDEPLISQP